MKITFFIGSLSGGGAERVICALASQFVKIGHETEILTVTKIAQNYVLDERVKLSTLDAASFLPKGELRVVAKMALLLKYVLFHRADCYVAFLPETIHALMFFRKLIRVPIIISERCDPNNYSNEVVDYLYRDAKQADAIVFQTEFAKDVYEQHIQLKEWAVIANPIDLGVMNVYEGQRKKEIVAAGRFTEQKNFSLLIDAFAKLHAVLPEYKLVIYGDGPLRSEYCELIEQLGLGGYVDMPGYISSLPEKIKDASLFVLSSDYEGMPNALMEAMSLGLPCISTDCSGGGPKELIQDGVNGILVPMRDVDALSQQMIKVLSNFDLFKRIGLAAYEFSKNFSVEKIAKKWLGFIKKICEGK